MVNFEPIIEYADRNATSCEQKISLLLGEIFVVVKKVTIENYDGICWKEKSIKIKIDKNDFLYYMIFLN